LTPETMGGFARGRMRSKQEQSVQALTGYLQAHHRFLLAEHLKPISDLQDAIARLSTEIGERLQPYEELLKRLETIPGVKRRLAEVILAEIGTDMQRFPNAQHCRWYVAVEANRVGSQGDQLLSQITGMDPKTIQRGRQELEHELAERPVDRVRLPGGGRPRAEKKMRS